MNVNVSPYRKFIVAFAAFAGVLATAASDGVLDTSEGIAAAVAFLGALGVYQVPNAE